MTRANATIVCLACLAMAGCHRDDFKLTLDMVEIAERQNVAFATNAPKKIAAMEAEDVILAVNGYPLTKQAYEDFMDLKQTGLMERKGMTSIVLDKLMDEYRVSYVKNFIAQRLLVDNAFATGIATTNEILSAVEELLKKDARKKGKKVADYLKKFNGKERYFLYELCVSHTINKLVSQKIPPRKVVDPEFTAAVQKQIDIDNASAEATNKMYKAKLEYYRKQILGEKLDFKTVVKSFSDDAEDDGIWGEFEEGDFDSPEVQAKVFALKEGEISDVIEDDDGLQLVKVLKIVPPVKDDDGRVIEREKRTLSRIFITKVPLIIRQTDILLTADLKRQMQIQAVSAYTTALSTNSVNRIEYPNGRDLF